MSLICQTRQWSSCHCLFLKKSTVIEKLLGHFVVDMFTLPPLPPKDYVLKSVNQNQKSAQEHTPFAPPRITQSSLSKFCYPVEYQENERLSDNVKLDEVNSKVLERWTDKARADWVTAPGKDDYLLHDVFKKYSVVVEPSYDARYKHKAG